MTGTVSVVDFTAQLGRSASVEEVNEAVREASGTAKLKGILAYTDEPLVSMDLKGNSYSSIFSGVDTISMGDMVKIVAWYDNEWGYACRIADLARLMLITAPQRELVTS
jgi:glyceraldehyde 3-phosphate dehydrogenase